MGDKNMEQLNERLQRSTIPNEFNRQKDLCKEIGDKKLEREEFIRRT